MSTSAVLIFPHQLFKKSKILDKEKVHFLVEEHLFYTQYTFHKEKLVLHRASMKAYHAYLIQEGYHVKYIESTDELHDCRLLIQHLSDKKFTSISVIDPSDYLLLRRIKTACTTCNIGLHISESPNFLNSLTSTQNYFASKKNIFKLIFIPHKESSVIFY